MVKIIVESLLSDSWASNIIITCAGLDSAAEQIFTSAAKDLVGEVGALESKAPKDKKAVRRVELEVEECSTLHNIIYVVPCDFPKGKKPRTEDYPPFDMQIRVEHHSKEVYSQSHAINRWGGASINFKIEL